MPDRLTLRLTQFAESSDHYRVELALEGVGSRQTAVARFAFALNDTDRNELRWYLEEYLQHPYDPNPSIAARVEKRMREIGAELFHKLFESNRDVTRLWSRMYEHLQKTRVEIVTDVRDATAIPWELLHDPQTDRPLALRAQSFVRTLSNPAQPPRLPGASGPIRILLVICRPGGRSDVPFRSVASRLIKGLSKEARAAFDLHVLRPPTFEQLSRELHDARDRGEPYHVVHFDGHGVYGEYQNVGGGFGSDIFTDHRPGKHGYLAFENHALPDNFEPVDGPALGNLLVETGVPVLVLNACRSAHAEHTSDSQSAIDAAISASPADDTSSPHEQVRAFGSLAQEVMDAGAAGVVAMRYNVYVVTAAQFVAELYATLTQGLTLGEAVSRGRKNLADRPLREVVSKPIPLADWPVPIVYEAEPVKLFPKPKRSQKLAIKLEPAAATPTAESGVANVPPEPDAGFFGRDETLLALDRAFDTQQVVLLHAYAGSGKTTTAAEFARWYKLTGGIKGPVLWTSFEQYTPLPRVLDTLGRVFEPLLEQNNIHWLTLTDEQRQAVALQVLRQIPVLWIWDNVEPVAGFPSGTQSSWSEQEQRELADFLRAARQTQAKFLLTSRRDERGWLGDLPARIQVPPMPLQERKQLARALAEKHGWKQKEIGVLNPLLVYTQGNPLTITVLVGQAIRDGLRTTKQIDDFVAKLRAGEAAFEDETTEGRTKSLGASLSYGFEHAFTDDERKILALLHFFQGFVQIATLQAMGNPEIGDLPEVRELTRETGIRLLDRAAEVGLLAVYGGYYAIHPVLPWYFKSLFEQYYLTNEQQQGTTRAYVESMGDLSSYYTAQFVQGNRDAINVLKLEAANLLYARQIAHNNGWWHLVIRTMQGLYLLYDRTNRLAELQWLVDDIVPDFVDPVSGGPLAGREDQWRLLGQYRVRLALKARDWINAERLQRSRVEWNRHLASDALSLPVEVLDENQRNNIRSLAVSVENLGSILREQNKSECVVSYEDGIALCQRIGDKQEEALIAFNLGHAYKDIVAIRDLEQAEHWYQHSLDISEELVKHDRSQCLIALGNVAYERFKEAYVVNQPHQELIRYLNTALQFYIQGLELLPPNAVSDLAVTHNGLGNIYDKVGNLDLALFHYREAIRYLEVASNFYDAGQARQNVAFALANAGRLDDALLYAQAALRNFEPYGTGAADKIQKTQQLIADIQAAMQGKT
ncbi:MAG TPA: CHAT domain-containing protein [Herpetosiphonaceae bacterium]